MEQTVVDVSDVRRAFQRSRVRFVEPVDHAPVREAALAMKDGGRRQPVEAA
jgi:hypothetical protein